MKRKNTQISKLKKDLLLAKRLLRKLKKSDSELQKNLRSLKLKMRKKGYKV